MKRAIQEIMNWSLYKNYLLMAFRVFRRSLGHTAINVLGLAIAISCSFLMYLWVQDEWKYNRFLEDSDRVAIVLNRETQTNGDINSFRFTSFRLKGVLEAE